MKDFLKNVTIFQDLEEDDLSKLAEMVTRQEIKAGEVLFKEGDQGDSAYIINAGAIEITKAAPGEDVLLAVVGPGEVIGEMALLDESPRMASAAVREDAVIYSITQAQLDDLMNTSASATRALLFTVTSRWRETEALLMQNEKMAQLGTLTAGMAHELNNPAAAIQRGSKQIQESFEGYLAVQKEFMGAGIDESQIGVMGELLERAENFVSDPIEMDSLTRSDIEYDIEKWLESREIPNAWELAPLLARLGLNEKSLDELAEQIPAENYTNVAKWVSSTFNIYELIEETGQASEHISQVVLALKTYAYQDKGTPQEFDLHKNLDEALLLSETLIGEQIEVVKDYEADLPRLQGFPSELGQVWTNLISNAVDAIAGAGKITIATRREDKAVVVDIIDNGSGIDAGIQDKVFDPFFTTKPPGKGAGLGLTISYNIIKQKHQGEITMTSRPGRTKFSVYLPAGANNGDGIARGVSSFRKSGDKTVKSIFSSIKNIAVVGASARPERAGHSVPAYLQKRGFNIIPVNPNQAEVLGQRSYPDLASIPDKVDVVQIFRRSDEVPAIVDAAIAKGAKVIWMQEGVIHPGAARKAREAGLTVVMDACMRKHHIRIHGKDPA